MSSTSDHPDPEATRKLASELRAATPFPPPRSSPLTFPLPGAAGQEAVGPTAGPGIDPRSDALRPRYRGDDPDDPALEGRFRSGDGPGQARPREVFRDGTTAAPREGRGPDLEAGIDPDRLPHQSLHLRPRPRRPRIMPVDGPWRLVLPHPSFAPGSAGRILRALKPLLELRGGLEPLYFKPDPRQEEEDAVSAWAEEHEDLIEDTVYFLVAGSPREVPFSVARHLSQGKVVGRLSLPSSEAYAAYAEKVVAAWDNAREARDSSRPLMAFSPDSESVLEMCRRAIVSAVADRVEARSGEEAVIRRLGDAALWKDALPALMLEWERAPAVLLAACHGGEPEAGDREAHGALYDQQKRPLRATDVDPARPFLQDGIAVFFACNGAGTPRERDWLGRISPFEGFEPAHDMASPLPQALLAHPRGPLAIVAHDDLILPDGLRDLQARYPADLSSAGVRPFACLIEAILKGVPVGLALQRLRRAFFVRTGELERLRARQSAKQQAQPPVELTQDDDDRLLLAWLRWTQLRNWTLLGDPRVALNGDPGGATLGDMFRNDEELVPRLADFLCA